MERVNGPATHYTRCSCYCGCETEFMSDHRLSGWVICEECECAPYATCQICHQDRHVRTYEDEQGDLVACGDCMKIGLVKR